MGLFINRFTDTIFLKNDSSIDQQINELKSIRNNSNYKEVDKDIKLLEYGKYGEEQIAYELKNANLGLYVLRDVTLCYEDMKAQIDYVVVSSANVYFIECKNLFGNITVDKTGQFKREYELFGKKIKESIYSPYTQAVRHREIYKKVWAKSKSKLLISILGNNFLDKVNFYKPLVVLANSNSYLDIKYAPKEIKNSIIRLDQLINYLKKDIDQTSYMDKMDKKMMKDFAQTFIDKNVNEYHSMAEKYNSNTLDNDDTLLSNLKELRKNKSKEMNVPPYYIFNDEELKKILLYKPTSKEELKKVLPPIKIKCHGDDILKIISNFIK